MNIDLDFLFFVIICLLIIILVYINRNRIFNNFSNNMQSVNYSPFLSDPKSLENSLLDKNGLLKNEVNKNNISPSYWYNYAPSENRSKCFACDAEGQFIHGSRCIDCEKKGGKPVDNLLNRVLTR
jgi:hypothetical protein